MGRSRFAGMVAAVLLSSAVHADGGHHAAMEIPTGSPPPRVEVEVVEDPVAGWNLHVVTDDFRFAPEHVNGPARLGEGYAHLYVDGKKIARLYGPWYHLGTLAPGKREIRVDLTANNHAPYTYQGKPVHGSVQVDVKE